MNIRFSNKSGSGRAAFAAAVLCFAAAQRLLADPGQYIGDNGPKNYGASSFTKTTQVVGAFFFYWYDVLSGQHLVNAKGQDELTTHPDYNYLMPIAFSYESTDWWARELTRMANHGIDLVLPDYWADGRGNNEWSNTGLVVLDEALYNLQSQGQDTPQIGMFYDTSSLLGVDIATADGQDQVYFSVRDFFSRIRPDHWARLHGRAIVVIYRSGGVVNFNGEAFKQANDRFAEDFDGVHLAFIGNGGMSSLGVPLELTFGWGAETPQRNGIRLDPDIAEVSPGSKHYNSRHTGNYGQDKLSRRNGSTYSHAWESVLRSNKHWVFVETFNEFHESTGIAPTREYGHRELTTTGEYARRFHAQ
jgi:hypothetical protein